IMISFAFIATQIRLGVLCEMVMVCGLLFVPPGSAIDGWLAMVMPVGLLEPASPAIALPGGLLSLASAAIGAYLLLLPLAHAGLFFNFYARRSLPTRLQG